MGKLQKLDGSKTKFKSMTSYSRSSSFKTGNYL